MRVIGLTKPRGAVKAKSSLSARGMTRKVQSRDFQSTSHCWEYAEHKCWDPPGDKLLFAFTAPLGFVNPMACIQVEVRGNPDGGP